MRKQKDFDNANSDSIFKYYYITTVVKIINESSTTVMAIQKYFCKLVTNSYVLRTAVRLWTIRNRNPYTKQRVKHTGKQFK